MVSGGVLFNSAARRRPRSFAGGAFSASHTALIAVDLMPHMVAQNMGPHPGVEVVGRTAELAGAVRRAGGTVVLVRAEHPPGSGFVPELAPAAGDIVVARSTIGAFGDTGLATRLRERAVRTVLMAGLATSMGVESTARAAADHGFTVMFAADAMSGTTTTEHDHALGVVFPRFGEVLPARDVLARLQRC